MKIQIWNLEFGKKLEFAFHEIIAGTKERIIMEEEEEGIRNEQDKRRTDKKRNK